MAHSRGIILLCHGSRDPAWIAPFRAIRDDLAAEASPTEVRIACLQFGVPSLEDSARELYRKGVRCISVVPMFMSRGGHVARDVPTQLEALQEAFPGLELCLLPSLGEMPGVRKAITRAVLEGLDRPGSVC